MIDHYNVPAEHLLHLQYPEDVVVSLQLFEEPIDEPSRLRAGLSQRVQGLTVAVYGSHVAEHKSCDSICNGFDGQKRLSSIVQGDRLPDPGPVVLRLAALTVPAQTKPEMCSGLESLPPRPKR